MSKIEELAHAVEIGKSKLVPGLVQEALDEGNAPIDILNKGMIDAMAIVGDKFKRNEIFVPEMLIAAKAMKKGVEVLKPYLAGDNASKVGKMAMGTVAGDLHDIGKNLVRMMLEGKGLTVIDLGVDVPPEKFVDTAIQQDCGVICCSALLTTTMPMMEEVVHKAEEAGVRDKIKIMVGGAPVTEAFCRSIGADVYTVDAASCADAAVQLLAC